MLIKAGLYVFFSLLLPTSWALYSTSDNVTELTSTNFKNLVEQDDAIWVVHFHGRMCGEQCEELVPEYKKLAKAVKGVIKVGSVNASEHNCLKMKYNVEKFPTIKIFGSNKLLPTDLKDQRTAKAIAKKALAVAEKKIKDALDGGSSQRNRCVIPKSCTKRGFLEKKSQT